MPVPVAYLLQLLLIPINSFYRLLESWLEGFGFAGHRLVDGKNFRDYNLRGCDFSNCNFSSADLRFADLRGASLRVTTTLDKWGQPCPIVYSWRRRDRALEGCPQMPKGFPRSAVFKDVQAKGAIGLEEAVHGSIN